MARLQTVERVLDEVQNVPGMSRRLQSLSKRFLGRPYSINPLVGSAEIPEVLTLSLDSFDCVTYMETVVALAGARTANDFTSRLKRIRYDHGKVEWRRRNHYMTDWIRNNERAGLVRQMKVESVVRRKERLLNVVPGLPPKKQRFACTPKQSIRSLARVLEAGDLIFFASTRSHLDIFHCGIVIRDGDRLRLRHASRSQGGVVEQDLQSFLDGNRMAGVILVRPEGPHR